MKGLQMISLCIRLWIIHKKRWEKGTLFIKNILAPEELRVSRALDRQACRPEQRQF